MIVSSAVTFVAVYRGTGTQLRNQIDSEISGDADELSHALASSHPGSAKDLREAAAGYIRAQPFRASSTLLYVTIPGAGIVTNRPELFGSTKPDNGETASQQARENLLSAKLLAPGSGYTTLPMPDVGNLRLLRRTVRLQHGGGPGAGGDRGRHPARHRLARAEGRRARVHPRGRAGAGRRRCSPRS